MAKTTSNKTLNHILAADVGGTHLRLAIFAHRGDDNFRKIRETTRLSRKVKDFPALLHRFLRHGASGLQPPVRTGALCFAGPVGARRSVAALTNLNWRFTAAEIREKTGLEELILMNDFEAVGYGFEVLLKTRPEAFVRLSRAGKLPPPKGRRPTAIVIGAGTGLGTSILVQDASTGRYRPVPGEGGHCDFIPLSSGEFALAEWARANLNRSAKNPADRETFLSGPGLFNLCRALRDLEPGMGDPAAWKAIARKDPYDRPGEIVRSALQDPLCRKALDLWLRAYARVARNSALFPLAPGGVFLAGGIAAKILPELRSGVFMEEFARLDKGSIRAILKRTPVFVVIETGIGLYGCASVAADPRQLG